ncbi:RodZ domain-containing protein [Larsenimonas salina]|uniref:RodZ domain-containing protein n=1 Tax=Larsenimonas salina TaxID=1295565 RepID=UPI0020748195|nr:RodZ domain-containing protein [Larsenimonas salina]MCM5704362.1 DUF4115 domain-containing protein [Larsenimonas salina]
MTERYDTAPSSPQQPAGTLLKQERERQGLSLDSVAERLNLRPSLVSAFEQNQFDQVSVGAYRRGYLRAYARLLGMDEKVIVDAHDREFGRDDQTTTRIAPVNTIKPPSKWGKILFPIVTLIVIAALVALTLTWWQSRDNTPGMSDTDSLGDTPTSEAIDTDTADSAPVDSIEPSDASSLPPSAPETENERASDSAEATTDTNDRLQVAAQDGRDGASMAQSDVQSGSDNNERAASNDSSADSATQATPTLALEFAEDSWVRITDNTGATVLTGLQKAGTSASAKGTPPFKLTIGNASHVTLTLNGTDVNLASHTRSNNVAKFTLNQ